MEACILTPINLKFQLVTTREEARQKWPPGTLTISPKQRDFITDDTFICGAIGGYGGSKTRAAAYKMLRRLSMYPKVAHMVIANTYLQLSKTTLRVYADVFQQAGLKRDVDFVYNKKPLKDWGMNSRYDDHEQVFSFRNGAQLVAVSAEKWEVHEGQDLFSIHADELWAFDPACFEMLLGRLRGWERFYPADKYPNAKPQFFCSTIPNGNGFPYEVFEGDTKRKNAHYIHFTSYDNLWLEENFAANLSDAVGEARVEEKIMGIWGKPKGIVFSSFNRTNHVVKGGV